MRTHCKRGHALTPDNLYINPNNGKRRCIQCKNESRVLHYSEELRQQAYHRQVKRALRGAYAYRNSTVKPAEWHSHIEEEWPLEVTPELPWSCTPTGRLDRYGAH